MRGFRCPTLTASRGYIVRAVSRTRRIVCGWFALCLVTPAAAQARCKPPTGKVLAHTAQVVVYTHKVRVDGGPQTDGFACRIATGATKAFIDPSRLLAQYDVEVPRATAAIGGLFAGAVVNIATGSRGGAEIVMIDLRPKHPKVSFDGAPSRQAGGVVRSLVVSDSGKVAWIVDVSPGFKKKRYEVAKSVGKNKLRVLDRSGKISPRSLRLSGSTLSWVDAGHSRTSTL